MSEPDQSESVVRSINMPQRGSWVIEFMASINAPSLNATAGICFLPVFDTQKEALEPWGMILS